MPKAIFGVIHLIVEDEGKVETFIDKSHELIYSIRIYVAQYAFSIKEGGYRGIDFVLLDYSFEVIDVCEIAGCQSIVVAQCEKMLMFLMIEWLHETTGSRLSFLNKEASFLEWIIFFIFFFTTDSRSNSMNLNFFWMVPSSIRLNQTVSSPLPRATICTFYPLLV